MLRDSNCYNFICGPDIVAAQSGLILGAVSLIIYHIKKPPSTDEALAGCPAWSEGLINHKPEGVLSTIFRI